MIHIMDVMAGIRTFCSVFGSQSSKSYIQPKQLRYQLKGSLFVLENYGPGVAHSIKLNTFGISKISDTKNGEEVGLSQAKGPIALNEKEQGDYEVPFLKYNMKFPFLIEWKSSTNEKSKSVWIYDSANHNFVLLKKREIIKISIKLFFISIFKKKQLLKYHPSILPKEKE